MADVFTKSKRSSVMASIRGTGNKGTELRLIALMRAAGIRGWRRGVIIQVQVQNRKLKTLRTASRPELRSVSSVVKIKATIIRPDFMFPKQRLAVFVDGCFFHGCPKHATWPKNNAPFWRTKIEGNMARDRRQTRLLRANGWKVLRIWEHALSVKHARRTIGRIEQALAG